MIARNSTFAYKGKAVDIKQVGRELGVRYVLEGSVRRAGNRVRVIGQLIEAPSGAHLWAERYERDLTDIFAVQDEITNDVAMAIEPALSEAERQRVSRRPPSNLDAWETYHRGLWHFLKQEPAENEYSKQFFQRAIELDAGFSPGYSGLALTHIWDGWLYLSRPIQVAASTARPFAQRAVILDDADATAHLALAFVFALDGNMEPCRAEIERAVALNPNHAWAWSWLGWINGFTGRTSEAPAAFRRAMRGSPHDPLMWAWMFWDGIAKYFARDFQGAVDSCDRAIRSRPEKAFAHRWRAAALAQLGRIEEAHAALRHATELSPLDNWYVRVRQRQPWMRPEDFELALEGFHKAGLPE